MVRENAEQETASFETTRKSSQKEGKGDSKILTDG